LWDVTKQGPISLCVIVFDAFITTLQSKIFAGKTIRIERTEKKEKEKEKNQCKKYIIKEVLGM
jgi:hypothetical protein